MDAMLVSPSKCTGGKLKRLKSPQMMVKEVSTMQTSCQDNQLKKECTARMRDEGGICTDL